MMMTGISIQCGAVHCCTSPEVDITRLSADNHTHFRRFLVSVVRLVVIGKNASTLGRFLSKLVTIFV